MATTVTAGPGSANTQELILVPHKGGRCPTAAFPNAAARRWTRSRAVGYKPVLIWNMSGSVIIHYAIKLAWLLLLLTLQF